MRYFIAINSLLLTVWMVSCKTDPYSAERSRMVKEQLIAKGIQDSAVVASMASVERHLFIPEELRLYAYFDGQLYIGQGQTIWAPNTVAYMTELLQLTPEERVLEIGTGSGYQAAVLAGIAKEVFTIEIIEELGQEAQARLAALHYRNVKVRIGDGYNGWPEEAPFDAILVTAAPDKVPQPLLDQLKEGGRMVIPVGPKSMLQDVILIWKEGGVIHQEKVTAARFAPFTRKE